MRTVCTTTVMAALLLAAGGADASAQHRGAGAAEGEGSLGERVYQKSCASCHGSDGAGIPGVYPALDGDPFVTNQAQLPIQVVLAGRAPAADVPQMPAYGSLLSNEQVAAVVSYIRTAWSNDAGEVDAEAVAGIREQVDPSGSGDGSVQLAEGWRQEGEQLVTRNCIACHQEGGTGSDGIFPNLAGNPVVVSAPEPLIYTILHGRGGMPSFSRRLSDEEMAYVISYIRTSWGNDASLVSPEMVSSVPEPEPSY